MGPRADAIRFAVSFAVLSTVLGWLFWTSSVVVGTYWLGTSMLAVPVISAMLASVGFGWRRKLTYASITFGLYVLSSVTAELAGLHAFVRQQMEGASSLPSVWAILYMAWLTTFPFVMLVLFVGRRPSLLWSREPNSGGEGHRR